MFWRSKLKFPPRSSHSVEDNIIRQRPTATHVTIATWDNLFQTMPFDIPFYTALKNRACILIYFSEQTISSPQVIERTLEPGQLWGLHVAAFLRAAYPILRCNLIIPDNPADPYCLETPLDVRDGNVQDFCHAIFADEHIDMIIKHEQNEQDVYYASAMHAPGVASILRKELRRVLRKSKLTLSEVDFRNSVRMMETIFPSPWDGVNLNKCVKLIFAGEARNTLIEQAH